MVANVKENGEKTQGVGENPFPCSLVQKTSDLGLTLQDMAMGHHGVVCVSIQFTLVLYFI